METKIFMATSMNGYIANENLGEDFLSHDNWNTFEELLEEYGHVIYGRTTYEQVQSWGQEYIDTFKGKIVIVISHKDIENKPENVVVCKGPIEALQLLKEKGFGKVLLSRWFSNK